MALRNVAQIYDGHDHGTSDGVATLATYRLRTRIFGAESGISAKAIFGNFRQVPDEAGANSITVAAAVESGSDVIPILFGGIAEKLTAPGAHEVSDSFTVTTSDFAEFRSRPKASSGETWPTGVVYSNEGGWGGGVSSGVDLTLSGSGSVSGGTGFGYGPLAIIAESALPSVMIRGDSIALGTNDSPNQTGYASEQYFDYGWLARSLNHSIPFVRWTRGGSHISDHAGAGNVYSKELYQYHTYGICEAGVNDLGLGAAAIKAAMLAEWQEMKAKGLRVAQSTIVPDGNLGNEATRLEVNAYIRSLPAPLDYVIEVADAVETFRDSGIWKPGYSDDNLHPNTTGHTAIAAAVGSALLADIALPAPSGNALTPWFIRRSGNPLTPGFI